jgi:hypothetical protein
VFDRGAADALGVPIGHAGAETRPTGLMGKTLYLQFETVELSLPRDPERAWEARVGFITDQTFQMPFQGILGTQGFLRDGLSPSTSTTTTSRSSRQMRPGPNSQLPLVLDQVVDVAADSIHLGPGEA